MFSDFYVVVKNVKFFVVAPHISFLWLALHGIVSSVSVVQDLCFLVIVSPANAHVTRDVLFTVTGLARLYQLFFVDQFVFCRC